jgi:chemotaxis protein CheY-P-specific phosphatase CheC
MSDEFKTIIQEEDKETIVLNKQEIIVGKISIGKTWKLLKKVSGLVANNKDIFNKLKEKKDSAFAEVMNAISSLPETTISELISIIIDKPTEFCDGISIDELPLLIQAILRHNDIKKILKNWQGVAEVFGKQSNQ